MRAKTWSKEDLTGVRYGKYTVVSRADTVTPRWLVRCDCGTVKKVPRRLVRSKYPKHRSCGCDIPCECGNHREPGAEACSRCDLLDGGPGDSRTVLSELRVHGPCTASFLVEQTGLSEETVYRGLAALRRRGRAVSFNEFGRGNGVAFDGFGECEYTWCLA